MTCSNCKNWGIRSTQGSAQHDQAMSRMGYKNCLADKSSLGAARFVGGWTPKCEKFEEDVKNADKTGK